MDNYFSLPRHVANLVVVSGDSEAEAITSALVKNQITDFHILKLKGPLYAYSNPLDVSPVDRHMNEVGRRPRNEDFVNNFNGWVGMAKRVLVAAPATSDGDAQALDVVRLIRGSISVTHVRLGSLDESSVLNALLQREPMRLRDAWPSITHRTLEIALQWAIQSHCLGVSVPNLRRAGWVVLGLLRSEQILQKEITLTIESIGGGYPFVFHRQLIDPNMRDMSDCVTKAEELSSSGGWVVPGDLEMLPPNLPWSYGDCILAICKELNMTIDEANEALMRLYQAQKITYPYSRERAVSTEAIALLIRLAEDHGMTFDPSIVSVYMRKGRHSFESPRPTSGDVDISTPLTLLKLDDAVLSLIVRNLLTCGVPQVRQTVDLDELPDWAQGLEFERVLPRKVLPWTRRVPVTSVRSLRISEGVFQQLHALDLGRVEDWVGISLLFENGGLVGKDGTLSDDAFRLTEVINPNLFDPNLALAVDRLIASYATEGGQAEPPESAVRRILEHLNMSEYVLSAIPRN